MKRRTLNPNFVSRTARNRKASSGMRNSAVHPALSRETATAQMPFQFSFKSSTPENCASHRAPFGFVANMKALCRSSKLSIRSRTLSSLDRSASRRSWLARTPPMLESEQRTAM
jgi:hypothetical protein